MAIRNVEIHRYNIYTVYIYIYQTNYLKYPFLYIDIQYKLLLIVMLYNSFNQVHLDAKHIWLTVAAEKIALR